MELLHILDFFVPKDGFGFMFKRIATLVIFTMLYISGIYYMTVVIWYSAEENAFIATISNMVMIVVLVISEQLEYVGARWLEARCKDKKPNLPTRVLIKYLGSGPALKTGLYLFYVIIIIIYALYLADPSFFSYEIGAYLASVYYGILFLIAADKFTMQVVKELKKMKRKEEEKTEKEEKYKS